MSGQIQQDILTDQLNITMTLLHKKIIKLCGIIRGGDRGVIHVQDALEYRNSSQAPEACEVIQRPKDIE